MKSEMGHNHAPPREIIKSPAVEINNSYTRCSFITHVEYKNQKNFGNSKYQIV